MFQGTIDDFYRQRDETGRPVLNFLDLPLMQSSVALPIG